MNEWLLPFKYVLKVSYHWRSDESFFLFSDNKRRNRPIIVRTTVPHWKSTYSINCIDYCKIRPVLRKKGINTGKILGVKNQLEWKNVLYSRKLLDIPNESFLLKISELDLNCPLQYSAESLSQLESFEEYCLFIPLVIFNWKL